MMRSLRTILCVFVAGLLASVSARAQTTYTFTNTASGTYDWTAGSSWDANGVPVSANDATVRFFSDNTTSLGGNITIDTDPATLTLNTLYLSGKGSGSLNPLTVTIGTADNSWTLAGSDPSIFIHGVDYNGSRPLVHNVRPDISIATNLVCEGNGSAEAKLSGDVTVSGGYGIVKRGSCALTLAGSNTFSGAVLIESGELDFSTLNSWGGGGQDITFGGSGHLGGVDSYTVGQMTVSNGFTATIDATMTISNVTGSGTLKIEESGKTLSILDGSGFTGTLANFLAYQGKNLQFKSLADSAGCGNIQFGGGSSDGGQDGIIRLYGDVGPLTLDNRQIEVLAKTANHGFETIELENNNATPANKWVINTDLINSETYRRKILIFGGSNTGDNEFAGAIPDGGNQIVLQKQDAGKWMLSGTNTYSGATTVSAGELALSVGGHCSNSAFTVSGGDLSVNVTNNTMQSIIKSLTFSSAGNFDFDFGSVTPSGSTAALMVTGNVNFVSSPTINCTGAGVSGLAPGSYPLIRYTGTLSGSPTAGTLGNTGGMLVVDTAQKTIWLYVAESEQPLTWQGPATSEWKANEPTYTYWQDASPVTTNYREYTVGGATSGDNVVFDDNGPGGIVTLNTAVYPSEVISTGTTDYTISGSGSISGSGQLKVTGSGTLTLATSNSLSGSIDISAGTLALAHTNAIGSASSVALDDGTAIHLKSDSDATFNTPLVTFDDPVNTSVSIDVDNNGSGSGKVLEMSGGMELYNSGSWDQTLNITSGNGYTLLLDDLTLNAPGWTPPDFFLVPSGANLQVGTVTRAGTGRCRLYLRGGAATTNVIGSLPYVTEEMSVTKDTAGTWKMGDVRVYDWDITISSGTLVATGTLDVTSSAVLALNGGELHLNNAGAVKSTAGAPWKIAGGNIENSSGAAINTSTYDPAMQWNSDFTFIGANGTNSDLYLGVGAVAMNASRIVTIQNADATLTVGGAISGTGYSLTKAGAGTLQLTGANTYSGDTFVNAGTLAISNNAAIADASDLYVTNGAKVALLGSSETVSNLYLNGERAYIATWGSSASSADFVDDDYFSGTGVLVVTDGIPITNYIGNLEASGITDSSATARALVRVAAGEELDVFVYWGTTDGTNNPGDWANGPVAVGSWTNAIQVTATNYLGSLNANTLYYYTFQATNSTTNIWAEPSKSFRTLGVPEVNNSTGATQGDATSATLRGNLIAGGAATGWICWGTNDGGTASTGDWDNVEPIGSVSYMDVFSTNVTGLATNATYWYRCYVSNALGIAWSDTASSFNGTPVGGGGGGGGGTVVPGADLNFDANDPASGVDGNNWDTTVGDAGQNFDFVADVTLESVTSSATIITNAYRFTGVTGDANVNNWNGKYGDGVACTWEFWLKPADTGDADQTIYESGGSGTGYAIWYTKGTDSDDAGVVKFTIDGGSGAQIETVTAAIDTTEFRHITLVYGTNYSGTIDKMEIYVDGVLVDDNLSATSGDDAGNDNDNTDISDFCGGDNGGLGNLYNSMAETASSGQFEGDIAILRVWGSEALSADQVMSNYNAVAASGGAIANLAPTNILSTSAALNASLTVGANTNYAVYVHFGTSDGGTNFAWSDAYSSVRTYTNAASTNETYAVSYPQSGLTADTLYYYTFRASNDAGNAWASPSWTFTTALATGTGSVFMFK